MSDAAADLQASVAAMLRADGRAAPTAAIGWRVYRNTVMRGAITALAANYPSVQRLVGDEWFEACARRFVLAQPPASPCLLDYGAGFADFLDGFEPARALPYLADVARMDRWWLEAHVAASAPCWTRAAAAELSSAAQQQARPGVHPSLRFGWFAQRSPSVWLYNRSKEDLAPPRFDATPEGIVLVRPASTVVYRRADAAEVALLSRVQAGQALDAACDAVAQAGAVLQPEQLCALFDMGVFIPPDPTSPRVARHDRDF